jgi:hypothetical protein
MRTMPLFLGAICLSPLFARADDPKTPSPEPSPQKDYTELTKLVHHLVVSQTPKEMDYKDGWGATIPYERLILPNRRTYLRSADGRTVMPHGAWKRVTLKLEDPAKDVAITVKDFKNVDGKNYRLEMEADVVLRADGEWQQWQKGLRLVGIEASADAYLRVSVVSDIGVALNLKKLPPEVTLSPKVTELALKLDDIRLRGGPIFTGEKGERIAGEIKNFLRTAVRSAETQVKELANEAIAESLKNGKSTLPAAVVLKALPK